MCCVVVVCVGIGAIGLDRDHRLPPALRLLTVNVLVEGMAVSSAASHTTVQTAPLPYPRSGGAPSSGSGGGGMYGGQGLPVNGAGGGGGKYVSSVLAHGALSQAAPVSGAGVASLC